MRQVNAGTKAAAAAPQSPPAPSVIDNVALIRNLDLTQRLAEKTYERELRKYQATARRSSRGTSAFATAR